MIFKEVKVLNNTLTISQQGTGSPKWGGDYVLRDTCPARGSLQYVQWPNKSRKHCLP